MPGDREDQILQEYAVLRDPAGDPEHEAVKAAIFIEDVFGITLLDTEIDPDLLGTAEGMRSLITRHRDPV